MNIAVKKWMKIGALNQVQHKYVREKVALQRRIVQMLIPTHWCGINIHRLHVHKKVG